MLFADVQRSVRLNKKKKSTNTSPYPDEVIDRLARAFYPAILACWNSKEGQREFAAWQAEQAHHATSKEKQSVPDGERPVVHIAIVCGLWQGASYFRGAPCFILTLISVPSFFIVTFVHLSFPYVLQCICLSQQYPFGAFLYLHTDRFFYMYPL